MWGWVCTCRVKKTKRTKCISPHSLSGWFLHGLYIFIGQSSPEFQGKRSRLLLVRQLLRSGRRGRLMGFYRLANSRFHRVRKGLKARWEAPQSTRKGQWD